MPLCLCQILPPRIKSMTAKKEAMNGEVALQQRSDLRGQLGDVLGILEDGKDFPMLVRVHAVQALEHLESFECDGAIRGERVGKDRAPQRMRVQHRASPASAYDGKVQSRFRRGLPVAADHQRIFVDFQKLRRVESAFIQPGGRNRESQRTLAHHRTEISARCEHPSALMKAPPDLGKLHGQTQKVRGRFIPAGAPGRIARRAFPAP